MTISRQGTLEVVAATLDAAEAKLRELITTFVQGRLYELDIKAQAIMTFNNEVATWRVTGIWEITEEA